MSDEEEDYVEGISGSELGTKEYWDVLYEMKLKFIDTGDDPDDAWFGTRNTQRIIEWIKANINRNGT